MRPVKLKCGRITVAGVFCAFVLIYFAYNHHKRVHSWVSNKVSELAWEKIHCLQVERWNSSSHWPPILQVSKFLRVKDKQNIFVNGLGCGQWVDALHGMFPKLKLTGVDANFGSVEYVKKLVNGSFHARQPYDLLDIPLEDDKGFDHALTHGSMTMLTKEQQCDAVKRMLPLLKPGGSLFIGHNLEECNEQMVQLNSKTSINMLPQCFWSRQCLVERTDVAEIIYLKESDAYENPYINPLLKGCASAVFIYKQIMINKVKDKKPLHPNLEPHGNSAPHPCTHSDLLNSHHAHQKVKEGIKKAVKDMKLKGLDMH